MYDLTFSTCVTYHAFIPFPDSDEYTEMFGATYSDGKAGPESKRKGPRPFGEKSIS
jgi:hypothetical protein